MTVGTVIIFGIFRTLRSPSERTWRSRTLNPNAAKSARPQLRRPFHVHVRVPQLLPRAHISRRHHPRGRPDPRASHLETHLRVGLAPVIHEAVQRKQPRAVVRARPATSSPRVRIRVSVRVRITWIRPPRTPGFARGEDASSPNPRALARRSAVVVAPNGGSDRRERVLRRRLERRRDETAYRSQRARISPRRPTAALFPPRPRARTGEDLRRRAATGRGSGERHGSSTTGMRTRRRGIGRTPRRPGRERRRRVPSTLPRVLGLRSGVPTSLRVRRRGRDGAGARVLGVALVRSSQ